jgi:hypothetical protein
MNSNEYWRSVDALHKEMVAEFAALQVEHTRGGTGHPFIEGQPANGVSKFITSVRNFSKGTTPGSVCEVSSRNSARFIFDGTHRLATTEEVSTYLEERAAEYQVHRNTELARKQQMVVYTSAAAPPIQAMPAIRTPNSLPIQVPLGPKKPVTT